MTRQFGVLSGIRWVHLVKPLLINEAVANFSRQRLNQGFPGNARDWPPSPRHEEPDRSRVAVHPELSELMGLRVPSKQSFAPCQNADVALLPLFSRPRWMPTVEYRQRSAATLPSVAT